MASRCIMSNRKYTGFAFLAGVVLIFGGCVSAGKYKLLEDDSNDTKAKLAAAESRISELEGKLGIESSERNKLEGSVSDMKTALEELQKRKLETEKRLSEFRELTEKFKSLVDAGKLKIKVVNGKMMLALSTDILFPSGSAKLSPAGRLAIQEVTGLLKSLKNRQFQIEGHTDNVPTKASGQYPSNWELASARAMSVLSTMESSGFPPDHISIASYGQHQPTSSNESEEGKAQNRRISIVIVPDLSGLPGFDELNRIAKTKAGEKSETKEKE
ncbi:MAG: flagellar motor protein MotB [Bdellovibrionota bacterium]